MALTTNDAGAGEQGPAPHERWLLLTMAAIQFTTMLDFLIIMPLGPQYQRVFGITTGQFGLIVSAYAISAGLAGIVAGFFLDQFDRKHAMLWLYGGFTVGTFCCALAPSYRLLVAARAVAGAFGGVASALILAIIGDAIPEQRRGAATGLVMSSFSLASICGVPVGLALAANWNWHVPFFVLAALSAVVLGVAARVLPRLRDHLQFRRDQHPARQFWAVLRQRDHQRAFLFMAGLTCTGFGIFPYMSNYLVGNVGLTEQQLPLVYLAGGVCTLFSMNYIGRWADRAGKRRVFTLMSLSTALPILAFTTLPHVPLLVALSVSTLFMVCMSGRMVPAMALLTASVESRHRGGFLSVNSSVQQFSSGAVTYLSGQLIGQSPGGALTHFPMVGVWSVVCAYACIYLARSIKVPEGPAWSVRRWWSNRGESLAEPRLNAGRGLRQTSPHSS